MEFFEGLISLLFLSGEIPADLKYADPVFSLGAGFMGLLVIILDWIAYSVLDKSFFSLTHGGTKSIRMIFLWGVAGVIAGYFNTAASIFQLNRLGCLAAGITGPLILPQLRNMFKPKEDEQKKSKEEEDK